MGNTRVDDLEVEIRFSPRVGKLEYWEVEVHDPLDKTEIERKGTSFILKRDFLNQYRAYKEEKIDIDVFSNTSLEYSVIGGGKGWYSRFQDKAQSVESIMKRIQIVGFLFVTIFTIELGLGWWAFFSDSRRIAEIADRLALSSLSVLGVCGSLLFLKVVGYDIFAQKRR